MLTDRVRRCCWLAKRRGIGFTQLGKHGRTLARNTAVLVVLVLHPCVSTVVRDRISMVRLSMRHTRSTHLNCPDIELALQSKHEFDALARARRRQIEACTSQNPNARVVQWSSFSSLNRQKFARHPQLQVWLASPASMGAQGGTCSRRHQL